jgi:hypothetical protein
VPVEVPLLLAETSELTLAPRTLFSRPKKFGTPTVSPLARTALVTFFSSAASVMLTRTVTMSPTLAAR